MDIDKFLKFAESLKLVRNEAIEAPYSKNIIDKIYTDPLPHDGIINKVNLPRTTIIMGRKGTGKSTIFQKSIKDMSTDKNAICIYIDVKTLYDNSTPLIIGDSPNMSPEALTKYLIYINFIKESIIEIKHLLKEQFESNKFKKVLGIGEEKFKHVNEELECIVSDFEQVFKNIQFSISTSIANTLEKKASMDGKVEIDVSQNPSLKAGISGQKEKSLKQQFEETMVTYFDIKKCLIENLLRIRDTLSIKYLYIYLDDYSEIDENAQIVFMDSLVAPLNNLADNFVKFKIAAYPKRFYYGKLDNQKFDEISLDFYDAYYTYRNISKMEEIALSYTKRLIDNRTKVYFSDNSFKEYFDMDNKELYEMLFELSMNIPRKMGYILSYCYESNLIHNIKITKASLANAAVRYYDEVVKKYFESNRFVLRPFNDRSSIENQKSLTEKIVKKQIENKSSIAKSTAKLFNVVGKPTSHFVIANELSELLDNLELNGYSTTYNKIKESFQK